VYTSAAYSELATAATACRPMAYQEGERAKKMENPSLRANGKHGAPLCGPGCEVRGGAEGRG